MKNKYIFISPIVQLRVTGDSSWATDSAVGVFYQLPDKSWLIEATITGTSSATNAINAYIDGLLFGVGELSYISYIGSETYTNISCGRAYSGTNRIYGFMSGGTATSTIHKFSFRAKLAEAPVGYFDINKNDAPEIFRSGLVRINCYSGVVSTTSLECYAIFMCFPGNKWRMHLWAFIETSTGEYDYDIWLDDITFRYTNQLIRVLSGVNSAGTKYNSSFGWTEAGYILYRGNSFREASIYGVFDIEEPIKYLDGNIHNYEIYEADGIKATDVTGTSTYQDNRAKFLRIDNQWFVDIDYFSMSSTSEPYKASYDDMNFLQLKESTRWPLKSYYFAYIKTAYADAGTQNITYDYGGLGHISGGITHGLIPLASKPTKYLPDNV